MTQSNPITKKPLSTGSLELLPASYFSYAQLTDAYNATRVDYIVPMPMNERKMRDYVFNYDVSLEHSVVAVQNGEILGLSMLGVRENQTWITRMGVLPNGRKKGLGWKMMDVMVQNSYALGVESMALDVIKNNTPAEQLFLKTGFRRIGEVMVVRRPPAALNIIARGTYVETVDYQETVKLMRNRSDHISWLTDTPSMVHAGNLSGLRADLPNGNGRGWLGYQNTVFQLGRLIFHIECGDPTNVATALLENLHWRHPAQDTIVENVPIDAPYWPAMQKMGYIVSFNRLEMLKPMR